MSDSITILSEGTRKIIFVLTKLDKQRYIDLFSYLFILIIFLSWVGG